MADTKQPEALRLAEWFEGNRGSNWPSCTPQDAAAELRRMHTENETLRHKLQTLDELCAAGDDVQLLRMGYAAARLEIASLQARVNECGAGAGCCAQAARIAELEAQLEAVGAGGVGPLRKRCPHQISESQAQPVAWAIFAENGHCRMWTQNKGHADISAKATGLPLTALYATPQPVAQAQAALVIAEAALADIGDADREPGDDVAWCEARAAQALPEVRAALITAAPQPAAQAQHPDDDAVDKLVESMKKKLAEKRAQGRSGWDTDCTQQRLSDLLRQHVEKGDVLDVANFCAFLFARGERVSAAQAATAKQSPHPEYDKGFSDGWNRCEARQAAAPTQAQVDERSDTVWLFIGLGQKNIRRAITLLEIDSMRAPELAFGPLLLKAIAELRKT